MQLPGIRGIELTVTDVRAKFKYGGNKEAAHVREIADRLEERGAGRTSRPVTTRFAASRYC